MSGSRSNIFAREIPQNPPPTITTFICVRQKHNVILIFKQHVSFESHDLIKITLFNIILTGILDIYFYNMIPYSNYRI
jgi:hypothetical protein